MVARLALGSVVAVVDTGTTAEPAEGEREKVNIMTLYTKPSIVEIELAAVKCRQMGEAAVRYGKQFQNPWIEQDGYSLLEVAEDLKAGRLAKATEQVYSSLSVDKVVARMPRHVQNLFERIRHSQQPQEAL